MASRQRPPEVDMTAWEFAGRLPKPIGARARAVLEVLAKRGEPTSLDSEITISSLRAIGDQRRYAIRILRQRAHDAGLRSWLVPRLRTVAQRQNAKGIDPETAAWLNLNSRTGSLGFYLREARWWLRLLARHGLPTDLDIDLEEPRVRSLLQQVLAQAERGVIKDLPGSGKQLSRLRATLRTLYLAAAAAGRRSRPIPPVIADVVNLRGNTKRLRAGLPARDRHQLDRLFDLFDALAADQQAGKTQTRGRWKSTMAQNTAARFSSCVNSLLTHARDAGWQYTLDEILTPEHVLDWTMRGRKADGSPMSKNEPRQRQTLVRSLLQRALDLDAALVDEGRVRQIASAMKNHRGFANVAPRRRGQEQDEKFIPTHLQIRSGFALVDECMHRARLRYQHGQMTRLEFWRELQDWAFFHLRLRGMWRNDTSATIDLLLAKRDLETGVVIVDGVRAKEVDDNYTIQIALLPRMVDFAEELLTFEGRSIERPLREGERPQHLHAERRLGLGLEQGTLEAGDRWGRDVLKTEDIHVAPLFRRHPDRAEGLSYWQINTRSRRILSRIGWFEATPHTFRVAGAIYWRMLGWDYEAIMRLGHWKDLKTLLECYAKLNAKDSLAAMAALAPSERLHSAADRNNRRRAAIVQISQVTNGLLSASDLHLIEFERAASKIRDSVDEIDRANAAARGNAWVPPQVPLLSEREALTVDEALRDRHPGGMKDVLGRDVFPSDRAARHARAAADAAEPSLHLRGMLERRASDRNERSRLGPSRQGA
jgi:hypothetical protein